MLKKCIYLLYGDRIFSLGIKLTFFIVTDLEMPPQVQFLPHFNAFSSLYQSYTHLIQPKLISFQRKYLHLLSRLIIICTEYCRTVVPAITLIYEGISEKRQLNHFDYCVCTDLLGFKLINGTAAFDVFSLGTECPVLFVIDANLQPEIDLTE